MLETPDGGSVSTAAVEERVELVTKQAAQIQSSAKSFAAAAGQGFHIEPSAAATLIKACRTSLDQLQKLRKDLYQIAQNPPLGTSPGASVVAPFTAQTATDNNGMRPVLESLQQTLQDMIQAYYKASTNYAETEAQVQASIKQAAAGARAS